MSVSHFTEGMSVLHIVAVSGGKDSTALALRLAEDEPRDYVYLCTPTGNELPALAEHWRRLESLLGKPLVRLKESRGPDGLAELIEFFGALPSHRMRWCTRMLKVEPTLDYLRAHAPCVQYVGLRADEETRAGIYGDVPGVEQRYPLREWGWGVEDVRHYLRTRGVEVPERTDCAWCYDQRLVEWYRLWLRHPDLYREAEAWEDRIGHTFRSPGRDTWPARLADLRAEFEAGRRPKGWERQEMLFAGPTRKRCRICTL